ncbi:hypothetical protein RJ639_002397 [Escallonia herrerae]|uniref:Glycosyltransferase 61 catalytic domain-containing protein n=1 Tax=Escallonia herrerae TaxID=1293975 RepID=A0AA88X961_9ASTE|nr:hypothetical protein RJ639_002397 [Escallonia herrerae]
MTAMSKNSNRRRRRFTGTSGKIYLIVAQPPHRLPTPLVQICATGAEEKLQLAVSDLPLKAVVILCTCIGDPKDISSPIDHTLPPPSESIASQENPLSCHSGKLILDKKGLATLAICLGMLVFVVHKNITFIFTTASYATYPSKPWGISHFRGPTSSVPFVEKVRPYPRKPEKMTMALIEETTLISSPSSPQYPKLIPNSKNFMHFHALRGNTYGKKQPSSSSKPPKARPRLVLASRSVGVGRVVLNQAEVKLAAEEVGFEVIVFEPTPSTTLPQSYALISSGHVMVGVHGAALTDFLFLRPGSVFVQIVPIGVENMAEVCFRKAAKELAMEYMEYKIGVEESSLLEKYGKDDIVLKGPMALHKKARSSGITDISADEQSAKFDLVKFMEYMKIMDIYLKEQDIKLDLVKFKLYLEMAYQKAKVLVDKEG